MRDLSGYSVYVRTDDLPIGSLFFFWKDPHMPSPLSIVI